MLEIKLCLYDLFKDKLKTIGLVVSLCLLIINLGFLIWYIFYGYQLFFHSDGASNVALAKEMLDTGQFFPQDWNYVNADLGMLSSRVFLVPLLMIVPNEYMAYAIFQCISALMILLCRWIFRTYCRKLVWASFLWGCFLFFMFLGICCMEIFEC